MPPSSRTPAPPPILIVASEASISWPLPETVIVLPCPLLVIRVLLPTTLRRSLSPPSTIVLPEPALRMVALSPSTIAVLWLPSRLMKAPSPVTTSSPPEPDNRPMSLLPARRV